MATKSENSVQYFINELVKKSDDLAPIMEQLYDDIADVPHQDLYMLRQQLVDIRVNISLLEKHNQEAMEEKKTKRRFLPFKK